MESYREGAALFPRAHGGVLSFFLSLPPAQRSLSIPQSLTNSYHIPRDSFCPFSVLPELEASFISVAKMPRIKTIKRRSFRRRFLLSECLRARHSASFRFFCQLPPIRNTASRSITPRRAITG